MGADKGSNRRRHKDLEKEWYKSKYLHGTWTWGTGTWHDFFRKGGKEISPTFRPSKPKETK